MLLSKDFYLRDDVIQIAKELLGKFIVTNINGNLTAGMITETEAYRGRDDKASHAYNNRLTKRTATMFREGGCAYVYLCYGIHHLFNVVTGPEGVANAVLIRALEPADNIHLIQQRRNIDKIKPQLTAGPGVMSMALGIRTDLDGEDLLNNNGSVWIEDRGIVFQEKEIHTTTRIGVDYAEECAQWPWRFYVKDSIWVSKK
ncbi:MAG: DNA-3-methyladenine glycosylase [Bacteroidetes bacterium]|nr:MAG: DNA-3-methyladenine glycosylase [Bacteroidota bacterium]